MKIDLSTIIIAALTIIVIYSSYDYLENKGEESAKYNIHYLEGEENSSKPPEVKQAAKTARESDEKILKCVDAYQKGYREGCLENAPERSDSNATTTDERAYFLGYQGGKKSCTAKREQRKERFERGKNEGCRSASGTIVRDETLYTGKSSYMKGWDTGYRQCRKRKAEKKRVELPRKEPKTVSPAIEIDRDNPEYRRGYRQGCDVSRGGYQKRDEESYLHSRAYRAGWTKGRGECKKEKREERSVRGRTEEPHAFDQGYNDGCDTATRYFRRDSYRYRHSKSYREGWRRGEFECRRREGFPPPPPLPFDQFGF